MKKMNKLLGIVVRICYAALVLCFVTKAAMDLYKNLNN